MSRLRLAAFIVATIASMAWLVSLCAADEPLYFPTVNVAPKIEPAPLAAPPVIRDVVLLVPDFPCNACIWWDKTVLPQVKGIRVTKKVDMKTRDGWPQLHLPDNGRTWFYYHPVTKQPLTAANIEALLREYPPAERPVVAAHARSSQWPAVRDAYLARHPACEACGSQSDLDVHHVKPFHVDPSRELDPTNLIALCSSDRTPDNGTESRNCHLHIGHRCADGRGRWTCENPDVRKDAETLRRQTAGRGE